MKPSGRPVNFEFLLKFVYILQLKITLWRGSAVQILLEKTSKSKFQKNYFTLRLGLNFGYMRLPTIIYVDTINVMV